MAGLYQKPQIVIVVSFKISIRLFNQSLYDDCCINIYDVVLNLILSCLIVYMKNDFFAFNDNAAVDSSEHKNIIVTYIFILNYLKIYICISLNYSIFVVEILYEIFL